MAKNDIFGQFEFSPNLISRKIRVAVKLSNVNKVKPKLHILKGSGA